MVEKNLIIDGLELKYNGLFDLNKLLKTIDKYSSEKGYTKGEKRRDEKISESGKEFSMELRHTKKKEEQFTLMVKMRIHITNLTEVEVLRDNIKTKLNKGNVNIIFDAWTSTNYENTWEQKPWYVFLRDLFEKGIYKYHTDKYYDELTNDCHFIYDNVKAHLNLFKI